MHQAVSGERLQCLPFAGEVSRGVDVPACADSVEVEAQVAHDVGDDVLADVVVHAEFNAAQDRDSAAVQRFVVAAARFFVLAVTATEHADGADAEAEQVAVGEGRVALKVAVKRAFALVADEAVFRAGKVVEADKFVAARGELFDGGLQ